MRCFFLRGSQMTEAKPPISGETQLTSMADASNSANAQDQQQRTATTAFPPDLFSNQSPSTAYPTLFDDATPSSAQMVCSVLTFFPPPFLLAIFRRYFSFLFSFLSNPRFFFFFFFFFSFSSFFFFFFFFFPPPFFFFFFFSIFLFPLLFSFFPVYILLYVFFSSSILMLIVCLLNCWPVFIGSGFL